MNDIVRDINSVYASHPGEDLLGYKLDISRYYRNLRIDPGQAKYLGIRGLGEVYMDMAFSFGKCAAMYGAQRSSDGLAWYYRTKVSPDRVRRNSGESCKCLQKCLCGDNRCLTYGDNFICVAPSSTSWYLWDSFLKVLDSLGLAPSSTPGHLSPPASVFIRLWVEFDLVKNMASAAGGVLAGEV